MTGPSTAPSAAVAWHDLECGFYDADLGFWEQLADRSGGDVLDLGCGTGRVALPLARKGYRVTGVDLDPDLVDELRRRAEAELLTNLEVEEGDARHLELGRRFALVMAPMQLFHMFADSGERLACLRGCAAHMAPGGQLAAALVGELPEGWPEDDAEPLPEMREIDGHVFSSQPISASRDQGAYLVVRVRQAVGPAGERQAERSEVRLEELTVEQLASEAVAAGLRLIDTVEIPLTREHVGSTVAILEAG